MKFQVSMNRSYVDMTLATVIFLDLDQVWCQTFRHQTWIRIIRQAPVEVMRLANFRDDLKILHKTQECSKEIWKRGHRSLIKNKTQTELINIVNLRILYQPNVSYAGQHTLSKVIYTLGARAFPWAGSVGLRPTKFLVSREKKLLVPRVKVTKLFTQLVITKAYGVRATTIESQKTLKTLLLQLR